jgi:hypothetical protein
MCLPTLQQSTWSEAFRPRRAGEPPLEPWSLVRTHFASSRTWQLQAKTLLGKPEKNAHTIELESLRAHFAPGAEFPRLRRTAYEPPGRATQGDLWLQ